MNAQAEPLWGGSTLRTWLREGGTPERSSPLLSRWRAKAFDISLAMQSALPPAPPFAAPPLFILGLWRTGTTLLHQMLDAVPGHGSPQTWQCFRPASFRLARPPAAAVPIPRPMDGLLVGADSPQEDEFALLLLGCPSLYRGFLDPRRLSELAPLLGSADAGDWVAPTRDFLRAVQPTGDVRLIVKSPNHLFRAEALLPAFPDSPLILTLRDPADTYWSNVRMWTAMADLYGLWAPTAGAIEAFVARAIAAGAEHLARLGEVRDRPIAIVSFERLAADPVGEALRALDTLGIPCPKGPRAGMERAARSGAQASTQRRPVPDFAEAPRRRLAAVQASLLARR